jgi:hypothetical protein
MEKKIMQQRYVSISTTPVSGENRSTGDAADQSRRYFMKHRLFALVLVPTVSLFTSGPALAGRSNTRDAAPPATLDPEDPQAKALSYFEQSPKDPQSCSNCQLYTGIEGEELGPCVIFSYRVAPTGKQLLVKANGWCRAWAPRQPL